MGGWLSLHEVITMQKMTQKQKLLFILSFIWMLHWGTRVTFIIVDMVIAKNAVSLLPLGL